MITRKKETRPAGKPVLPKGAKPEAIRDELAKQEVIPTPAESLQKLFESITASGMDIQLAMLNKDKQTIELFDKYEIKPIDGLTFALSTPANDKKYPVMDHNGIIAFALAIEIGTHFSEIFNKIPKASRGYFIVSFNHQLLDNKVVGCNLIA